MDSGFWRQLIYTCLAYQNSLMIGVSRGFTNFMSKHPSSDHDITMSENDISWISCICVLLNPVGSLISGVLLDSFGRVVTMKLATLLYSFSWLVIAITTDRFCLFAAYVVVGISVGMAFTCVVYVAEISSDKRRCVLLSGFIVFYSCGVMVSYLITYFLPWRHSALVFMAISGAICALLFALPEPPQWYVKLEKREKATQVLQLIRNLSKVDAEKEYERAVQNFHHYPDDKTNMKHILHSWKPLLIAVVFQLLVQCSGFTVLLVCSRSLFKEIDLPFDKNKMALAYSAAVLISSFFSPLAALFGSRKKLVTISSSLIAVSLVVMLASLHYKYSWVVQICICVYVFFNIAGTISVVESLPSEIFRLQVRGVMCGILQAYSTVLQGTLIKIFPALLQATSVNFLLVIFTAFSIVLIFFGVFVLPETKGKTFEQIQAEYFDEKPEVEKITQT